MSSNELLITGSMPGMNHGESMDHRSMQMNQGAMPGMSGMAASPEGKKIKTSRTHCARFRRRLKVSDFPESGTDQGL
jgi:hypothetical protein